MHLVHYLLLIVLGYNVGVSLYFIFLSNNRILINSDKLYSKPILFLNYLYSVMNAICYTLIAFHFDTFGAIISIYLLLATSYRCILLYCDIESYNDYRINTKKALLFEALNLTLTVILIFLL